MRYFIFLFITFICFAAPSKVAAQSSFEGRWFAPSSPWNATIAKDAVITSFSATAIQAFIDNGKGINSNWDVWTPAVIYADSSKDKTMDIIFYAGFKYQWIMPDVPITQELLDYVKYKDRRKDLDGKTCLYDEAKKGFYSFWNIGLTPSKTGITAVTGGFSPLKGSGWSSIDKRSLTPGLGRAGGASYCGGIIRKKEMKAGLIDHALAIHWPNFLILGWEASKPLLQYPATGTDGISTDAIQAIPYGARLQLDPSLTDDQLRDLGLNKADIVVAHALQKYGGYIVDATLGPAVIGFENAMGKGKNVYGTTSPYPRAVYPYLRFVGPPPVVSLDTAGTVGTPVRLSDHYQ